MIGRLPILVAIAICISAHGLRAEEKSDTNSKTVGSYRIELHVLSAEPFYTAEEAKKKHVTMGMLIEGGAAPVQPDAALHPNHHLVVHVFDEKTGHAVTGANVSLNFTPVGADGKSSGDSIKVPVVIMQAIGMGAEFTHYGNNVMMNPGSYNVLASVNGQTATFEIAVSDVKSNSMGAMHSMGGMQMH